MLIHVLTPEHALQSSLWICLKGEEGLDDSGC